MFRRLGIRLSHYDWAAIVGSALFLIFVLVVVIPGARAIGNAHHPQQKTCYAATDQEHVYKPVTCVSFWVRTFNDPVAAFTFVLGVFTLVLGAGTMGLWWVTERTLRHAQTDSDRQSRETREQIELARQQFIATHRPRIAIRRIVLSAFSPGAPVGVVFGILNSGSSVAHIDAIRADIGIRGWQSIAWDEPSLKLKTVPTASNLRLESGIGKVFTIEKTLADKQLAAILSMQDRLYVAGTIYYRDENGAGRSTGFIRWYDTQFDRFTKVPESWVSSEMEWED